MKITMLGISGSGKTVYMSAMSALFFQGDVNGYTIANRNDSYSDGTFVFKKFDEINTLYEKGEFPNGTSSSTVMPLELRYRGNRVLDIDWIEYRGGAIKELASGVENDKNAELFATLIASDVVLVLVDSVVLHTYSNDMIARNKVGANEISQLLTFVARKKHLDVIFLLTKIDSSFIDIKRDLNVLCKRVERIYTHFLTETNTDISMYPIIPVGAIGVGNVKTERSKMETASGSQIDIIKNTVTNYENMHTIQIAASFATALLKCLDSETQNLNTKASKLANELNRLVEKFSPVKNIIDILFFRSKRRGRIFTIEREIDEDRMEIKQLEGHRMRLTDIASRPD